MPGDVAKLFPYRDTNGRLMFRGKVGCDDDKLTLFYPYRDATGKMMLRGKGPDGCILLGWPYRDTSGQLMGRTICGEGSVTPPPPPDPFPLPGGTGSTLLCWELIVWALSEGFWEDEYALQVQGGSNLECDEHFKLAWAAAGTIPANLLLSSYEFETYGGCVIWGPTSSIWWKDKPNQLYYNCGRVVFPHPITLAEQLLPYECTDYDVNEDCLEISGPFSDWPTSVQILRWYGAKFPQYRLTLKTLGLIEGVHHIRWEIRAQCRRPLVRYTSFSAAWDYHTRYANLTIQSDPRYGVACADIDEVVEFHSDDLPYYYSPANVPEWHRQESRPETPTNIIVT